MANLGPPRRPVLDPRTPPAAGMKRVRFHGGPYAGKVEDVPSTLPYVDCIKPSAIGGGVSFNAAFPPSPTVAFSTIRYELTRYSDGSWHAHTPLGMKALLRNANRKYRLQGTFRDVRFHIGQGNINEAMLALGRLEELTCGT